MIILIQKRLRRNVLSLIIICINLLFVFSIAYMYWLRIDQIRIPKYNEYSKYHEKQKDALPAIDDTMSFPANSIFFIEASCKGLSSRQACSVESAARANPDRRVIVFFTCPVTWDKFKTSGLSTLLGIDNVDAARIHLDTYTKHTPLHEKLKTNHKSLHDLNMNLVDILKYVTLFKYDGIYLALDVIVAQSFKNLGKNWVVKQSPAAISSDIFSFSDDHIGRSLANIALNIMIKNLDQQELYNLWSFDSDSVMKRLVNVWCMSHDILELNPDKCLDLRVREPNEFYPISFYDRKLYFDPVNEEDWRHWQEAKIYTYPIFDRFTKFIIYNEKSLFKHIAQKYCPTMYNFYGFGFGTL